MELQKHNIGNIREDLSKEFLWNIVHITIMNDFILINSEFYQNCVLYEQLEWPVHIAFKYQPASSDEYRWRQ